MQTQWDYSKLADAYLKRPSYSKEVVESILNIASITEGQKVCDIGAGTAHLTLMLAEYGLNVTALEPNNEMRRNGIERTKGFPNVKWVEAVAENTMQVDSSFDLVTFGSSFNVTDKTIALKETVRILKPGSWFVCMWNHRDLSDSIQSQIEKIIKDNLPDYDYGSRREDQTQFLVESGFFETVKKIEGQVMHEQSKVECVEAWRSHGTLYRQAGIKFDQIIQKIKDFLDTLPGNTVKIPYTTRAWVAKINKKEKIRS